MSAKPAPDPLAGLPYEGKTPIGGGAYADVYAARGKAGPVVIKVARAEPRSAVNVTGGIFFAQGFAMHTGSIGGAALDANEILAAEAKVLRGIDHPSFPKLLEERTVGTTKKMRALVLQRFEGRSWRRAIYVDRDLGLDRVLALVRVLAELRRTKQLALHGDLKPDNLIIQDSGDVAILDPSSGMNDVPESMGPATAPPRRLFTTEWYNPAFEPSDVPAIGLILAEAAAHAHPLLEAHDDRPEKRFGPRLEKWIAGSKVVGGSRLLSRYRHLPTLRELEPSVSPAIEAVALKCLGLNFDKGLLERVDPFPDVAAVEKALAQALPVVS